MNARPVRELPPVVRVEHAFAAQVTMLGESVGERRRHVDDAPLPSLGHRLVSFPDRALHLDESPLQIEIAPLHSQISPRRMPALPARSTMM